MLKSSRGKVSGRKTSHGAQWLYVYGSAGIMIFCHYFCFGYLFVQFGVGLEIVLEIGYWHGKIACNLHCFHKLAAKNGTQAQSSKMSVCVNANTCIGAQIFTCRTYADDGTLSASMLPVSDI